jgi:hypothetical protein
MNKETNKIGEALCIAFGETASFLDSKNIVWKKINNEWIGKRSVWTFDFRACWLEDTEIENVKSWWCGEKSDYNEIFKRD